VFEKIGDPLTKHLALRDGKIVNDSSAYAWRMVTRAASKLAWRRPRPSN
jgi:hypothetical protein